MINIKNPGTMVDGVTWKPVGGAGLVPNRTAR